MSFVPNLAGRTTSVSSSRDTEAGVPAATRNGYRVIEMKPDLKLSRHVFFSEPEGVAAEQYRILRRHLNQQFPDSQILMVTSPGQAEGKTLNAVNVAWALADGGIPTLLLETDFRRPCLCSVLGCRVPQGLEAALRGSAEPRAVVSALDRSRLCIAAVNVPVKDPVQLIRNEHTRLFLDWARTHFERVVLDAPPVLGAADTLELSAMVDAVLMVVRARVTQGTVLVKAMEALGDRVCGVILNDASRCWDFQEQYMGYYSEPAER
jgi:Mrp family chromosome partitioning ATPase